MFQDGAVNHSIQCAVTPVSKSAKNSGVSENFEGGTEDNGWGQVSLSQMT